MTKAEETLFIKSSEIYPRQSGNWYREDEILQAMRQHAMELAEWIVKEQWVKVTETTWRKYLGEIFDGKCIWKTTEQLYDNFNNQEP